MTLSKKRDGSHTIHMPGGVNASHMLNGAVGTFASGRDVKGEFRGDFAPRKLTRHGYYAHANQGKRYDNIRPIHDRKDNYDPAPLPVQGTHAQGNEGWRLWSVTAKKKMERYQTVDDCE
jgi:hypothetical protein